MSGAYDTQELPSIGANRRNSNFWQRRFQKLTFASVGANCSQTSQVVRAPISVTTASVTSRREPLFTSHGQGLLRRYSGSGLKELQNVSTGTSIFRSDLTKGRIRTSMAPGKLL